MNSWKILYIAALILIIANAIFIIALIVDGYSGYQYVTSAILILSGILVGANASKKLKRKS